MVAVRYQAEHSTVPRRAYLLGTNFCGSTVFGQALGAHPEMRYLGEVDRLVQHPASFFAPEPEPPCRYCDLRGVACPVWTPARVEGAKAVPYGRVMDYLEGELDERVLIDGSKHPFWMRAAAEEGALDPGRTVAFLNLRSPFAFCDSFRNRTGCQAWEAANVWRDVYYDSMRLLNRLGLPYLVARYESFALDPEATLRPACALLGVGYDPWMPFFQDRPSHDVGGNISSHAVPRAQDPAFSSQEFQDRMPRALVGLSEQSKDYGAGRSAAGSTPSGIAAWATATSSRCSRRPGWPTWPTCSATS